MMSSSSWVTSPLFGWWDRFELSVHIEMSDFDFAAGLTRVTDAGAELEGTGLDLFVCLSFGTLGLGLAVGAMLGMEETTPAPTLGGVGCAFLIALIIVVLRHSVSGCSIFRMQY